MLQIFRTKYSGVITVFLSLTLLLVMSILFTLLESARSRALNLKAQMIANSSIESTFASYDKHLFDRYGLLFFAGKDSCAKELEDIAYDYARMNSQGTGDWLSCSAMSVSALNYVLATDDEGEVFIRAVCDYMEGAGLIEMAAAWLTDNLFSTNTELASNEDGEIDLGKVKDEVKNIEGNISNAEEDEATSMKVENEEELKEEYEKSKNELKNWSKKGILSLVCDDAGKISDSQYDMEQSPSTISDDKKKRRVADIEAVSTSDALLFDQYVYSNLNSYMKDSEGRLELEYIVCGKENNVSNLSSIAKRIVAIRSSIDYINIRSDAAKVSEAYAIGVAVAGWTGIPSLVSAVKESVLVLMALADGISDTKKIFAGEKDDKGLSYEDYLRGFLLLEERNDKAYRTMDVLQWNIVEEEAAFRFTNCIYACRINLSLESKKLFPLLPAPLSYSFNMESAYAYGKVTKYR